MATTYFLEAPLRMLCHRDRCFGKGGTWKVFFALLFSTIPVSLPVAGKRGQACLRSHSSDSLSGNEAVSVSVGGTEAVVVSLLR